MIFGHYVINAEQAAEISEVAIKTGQIDKERFESKQAKAELKGIYENIRNAASRGLNEVRVFIMYQSTYDDLVAHGFSVKGGHIKEAMPEEKSVFFGKSSDLFCIKWAKIANKM